MIDDDLPIRVLLHALLARLNFDVVLAEDGEAGLRLLNSSDQQYVVVLDLMMPRLNGFEFIEHIRSMDRPVRHIIVFTAAGQRGLDRIPAGAVCSSIFKPFDLEKFVEMIADCVNGHD